jgi:hypothetical protein
MIRYSYPFRFFFPAIVLTICSGCHRADTILPTENTRDSTHCEHLGTGAISNDGTYYVEFLSDPNPIAPRRNFELRVTIWDPTDRSHKISDATLDVDAAMPAHQHGMIRRPTVETRPDGSFIVRGMLFHMSGRWELYLDVTRSGMTERAQFEFNLE